jgi:HEAT repeat protein/diketogulonate reductase-like aldo/keto reductase
MRSVTGPAALFDDDVGARLSAASQLDPSAPNTVWAFREAALFDEDARVRSAAVEALQQAQSPDVADWLIRATEDEKPSVRDLAWQGLAVHGAETLLEFADVALSSEPHWWVRRSVVRAIGSRCGSQAAALLIRGLDDPQWRVRNAIVQALKRMLDQPSVMALVRKALDSPSSAVRGAAAYAIGQQVAPEMFATSPVDDDPAVAAERLATESSPPAIGQLALMLADPHETLRREVVSILEAAEGIEVARAVAPWLDEPRLTAAHEATLRLLSYLSFDAVALAHELADRGGGRGCLGWAFSTLVQQGQPELVRNALESSNHDVRGAAATALTQDPASFLRIAEVTPCLALADRHAIARWFLNESSADLAAFAGRFHIDGCLSDEVKLRAATLTRDFEVLRGLLNHKSGFIRAGAASVLVAAGQMTDVQRRSCVSDSDPWVQIAVLSPELAMGFASSDEPVIRRAAAHVLAQHPERITLTQRADIARELRRSDDVDVRCAAARLLVHASAEESLPDLLSLNIDSSPAVRSLSAQALEGRPGLAVELRRILQSQPTAQIRRAAYQWLAKTEPSALEFLLDSLRSEEDPDVIDHLEALTVSMGAPMAQRQRAPRSYSNSYEAEPPPMPTPHPSCGPLGLTGIVVSPLIFSGANSPPSPSFHDALASGVNTFFWEPKYETLTAFLRKQRPGTQVIAGTYHSGADAITHDVEASLRTLRRDCLDVFLLFWVRSSNRVSNANFEALERLRSRGLLRTFGFSTHLRDVAKKALVENEWPVLMTRHSLAHPGAESTLLPLARERSVGVLTFTATCYGRLLDASSVGIQPPSAAECYRYSLDQPGVCGTVSAPRNPRELAHNLGVLSAPALTAERTEELRRHGRATHERSVALNTMVRQVPSLGHARFNS